MTASGGMIAVDWGTTNRRAFALAETGGVSDAITDGRGVLSIPPGGFQDEVAALRRRIGDLPVLAAGMVGSTLGWRDVPYVAAPASLRDVGDGRVELPGRVTLLPGVSLRKARRPNAMRGEETLILGGVAAGMIPLEAFVCRPGTHTKWVKVRDGAVSDWTTAMVGELFGLLGRHGTLSGLLDGEVAPDAAFRQGLDRALATDVLAGLFEVRAGVLLGEIGPSDAASRASGLLIGADVAARRVSGRTIHLAASGALACLYATAIEAAGGVVVPVDDAAAFAFGIHSLRWAA